MLHRAVVVVQEFLKRNVVETNKDEEKRFKA